MINDDRTQDVDGIIRHLADARALLDQLFRAAIQAVHGETVLRNGSSFDGRTWRFTSAADTIAWDIPDDGQVVVVGAGKAAASLARGLEAVLGARITAGCVVVKHGHGEPVRRVQVLEAGHPVPDAAGLAATHAVMDMVRNLGPRDRVFVLLTGGASSLLVAPAVGLTLDDKAVTNGLLLRSGASIHDMNAVRKLLSAVKGGGLLDLIGAAPSITLAISDVPGGDIATIGSGPTLPERPSAQEVRAIVDRLGLAGRLPNRVRAFLDHNPDWSARTGGTTADSRFVLLANSATALAAARSMAAAYAFEIGIVDAEMTGATHDAARQFADALRDAARNRLSGAPPMLLFAAGETTLSISGDGLGGRNQEFALVAAQALAGVANVAVLAAGTDGTDGPTDAAGAFISGDTIARADAAGLDTAKVLARNDSYRLFDSLGDLYRIGPTGTNVMDLVIGIAW